MSNNLTDGRIYATGRRKTSVARVWLKVGSGSIKVNGLDVTDYFKGQPLSFYQIRRVFDATSTIGFYDVVATVKGGGVSGQIGALIHGISRAIDRINPALHGILRKAKFLTRDSRVVERKKYGQPKARKKFQFAKR